MEGHSGGRASAKGLRRFTDAQQGAQAGHAAALAEIRAGGKQGHWIWYIFPQLSGLGRSAASEQYGIAGIAEAEDYLREPVLRQRLLSAAAADAQQLRKGQPLAATTGSEIDVLKRVSSLTLFGSVARLHARADDEYRELAGVAEEVLAAAERAGYPRCAYTLARFDEPNKEG
jgi:uncharacterized protein (DUF1810 family)